MHLRLHKLRCKAERLEAPFPKKSLSEVSTCDVRIERVKEALHAFTASVGTDMGRSLN